MATFVSAAFILFGEINTAGWATGKAPDVCITDSVAYGLNEMSIRVCTAREYDTFIYEH